MLIIGTAIKNMVMAMGMVSLTMNRMMVMRRCMTVVLLFAGPLVRDADDLIRIPQTDSMCLARSMRRRMDVQPEWRFVGCTLQKTWLGLNPCQLQARVLSSQPPLRG